VSGRNRRRVLAASLVLATATLARAALGPVYGGRITVGLGDLPARFDPAPARSASARLLAALVHERLVELGPPGVPGPALAQSWTTAAGGREWTLHLHPGLVFHDGTPVTASEVVRSLRRFARSPSSVAAGFAGRLEGGAAFRNGAANLGGVVAVDPHTVSLRLRAPSAAVLSCLAAPDAAITSPRGAGAGPFVPTTMSPIRGRAALVAFRGHLRGRPFLDGVTAHLAGDAGAGATDVTPAIAPGPLAASLLLVLDPGHAAFVRADLRRAVAASIDRDELVRSFVPGGVLTVSPLPPLLAPALPAPRDRPAKGARRSAAGPIVIAVSTEVPALVSQRIVASLGAAGIQAVTVSGDPDSVWTVRAAARLVAWAPEVPDALLALEELAALARWDARGLLARAGRAVEPAAREARIREAEAALRAQYLAIPLAALPLGYRARPGLHGVTVDAGGRVRLENAWAEP
jgi:ABC-type transport system substrate-binding protein